MALIFSPSLSTPNFTFPPPSKSLLPEKGNSAPRRDEKMGETPSSSSHAPATSGQVADERTPLAQILHNSSAAHQFSARFLIKSNAGAATADKLGVASDVASFIGSPVPDEGADGEPGGQAETD
ncbi:hypothetical protein [Salipiger mucosus]|uniref:hypothetical protein n=1 Tax=Salipiger mucosus TaxID=263378 RepID=UPI0012EB3804|nr:hypothetical protein [Salipiger mucosus]